jgi:hypothetical protein
MKISEIALLPLLLAIAFWKQTGLSRATAYWLYSEAIAWLAQSQRRLKFHKPVQGMFFLFEQNFEVFIKISSILS